MSKTGPAGRAEKAAVLAELLGAGLAADISGEAGPGTGSGTDMAADTDPASLEWHRNRLIQRFRDRGMIKPPAPDDPAVKRGNGTSSSAPWKAAPTRLRKLARLDLAGAVPRSGETGARAKSRGSASGPQGVGAKVVSLLDPARLNDEHPAVLALLLANQDAKVTGDLLRSLEGAQARAVIRLIRAARARATADRPGPAEGG